MWYSSSKAENLDRISGVRRLSGSRDTWVDRLVEAGRGKLGDGLGVVMSH